MECLVRILLPISTHGDDLLSQSRRDGRAAGLSSPHRLCFADLQHLVAQFRLLRLECIYIKRRPGYQERKKKVENAVPVQIESFA